MPRTDPGRDAPLGFDATAYAAREAGFSPEPIRDAVLALVGGSVRGAVLDAGSGSGGWIRRVQASCADVSRIVSVDIVDAGAGALPGVEFHRVDLSSQRLPCGDAELDWAFALEVLEHLANPRHFLHEVARCLRPGGRFVASTPHNESLRAKLSFVLRGYFPAFCDHDYAGSGHITPIFELDVRRMASEAGFSRAEFFYPLDGQVPRLAVTWQSLSPRLRGKLWSDSLLCVLTK